ncbi:MAG: tRNA (N6-isopentenyl adenosine(37)-C2)-methylthiotransferase MiaB [Acidiphilium sp. 37-64-53]|uniref:tRNA (N6-isopentenyl adenosine(37)-C2)-methylthiotransferase MiaB n=1 Tax=Acidiphilium TaxID=522 RepID=UPI000BD8262D|nr:MULTISPECIES: tRNA (N6-isopentenyl adenosine(37)-C2)-methylthiotransferase MiaB [Acidiphilium]OYW02095.1 MAG: tRNA (N6-isopentenyl adenosine(37)-C2)-methylthiotransferase MiaB [Acidiphilium sp. 37-64-53]OZB26026.1 MAG: tRNA (N6-isopentenyl adenosine(37)-C2)-methylthiotransferase MiaB [Acidiphilium sp. 34-64-41]HQT84669.1 tRNA (N6-isopentenyl adenosine(37)-C2)-methylthiotransferase MiaB [Acidiphilium rubrum]
MTETTPIAATNQNLRTLHIVTWGCQMNAYDSLRMADLLRPLGYREVATDDADMVIFNTCHIRERAADKLFSALGRLRAVKDARNGRMMIAVAGCVAQAEGAEILRRAPYVDLVVGSQAYHKLPELIAAVEAKHAAVIDTDFPAEQKFDFLPETQSSQGPIANLAIQEGCDKFCTFCVVPYTRGAEASRPVAAIIAEARRLIAGGAREIALLGQNVNAWHGEGPDGKIWPLSRLLATLADLQDLARLRYTTSHPRDMSDDLIQAHRTNPKLMPFLHLPVQSGADAILTAMNRRHTADDFRRIVEKLRNARPDIAFSSDFIIGFPGETDADFAATMRLVREVEFALAYSFTYSRRPGTRAADAPDQIPAPLAHARLMELQETLRNQQHAFNRAQVGKRFDVLFTGPGRHPGQIAGRSPYLQPVVVEHANLAQGSIHPVTITSANPNSLMATLNQEQIAA